MSSERTNGIILSHDTLRFHFTNTIYILLKPGHYDILYARDLTAQSPELVNSTDEFLAEMFNAMEIKPVSKSQIDSLYGQSAMLRTNHTEVNVIRNSFGEEHKQGVASI